MKENPPERAGFPELGLWGWVVLLALLLVVTSFYYLIPDSPEPQLWAFNLDLRLSTCLEGDPSMASAKLGGYECFEMS